MISINKKSEVLFKTIGGNLLTTEIKIGNKPTGNYIMHALNRIKNGEKKVVLLSRGRAISKTFDVLEIIKTVVKPIDTRINSKSVKFDANGKEMFISSVKIEIELEEGRE